MSTLQNTTGPFPVTLCYSIYWLPDSNYGNLLIIKQMKAFISFSFISFPLRLPGPETGREQPAAPAAQTDSDGVLAAGRAQQGACVPTNFLKY